MSSQGISTEPTGPHCPTCGAALRGHEGRHCWRCGEDLAPPHGITTAPTGPPSVPAPRQPAEARGDSSLLGVAGILAVGMCMALLATGPGALIPLAILVTPALIRTYVTTLRRDREGKPADVGGVLATFLCSIGVVATVGLASVVAFFVVCFPVGLAGEQATAPGGGGILLGICGGLVAALATAVALFGIFWRRKEE
jgi:hypothetical protein